MQIYCVYEEKMEKISKQCHDLAHQYCNFASKNKNIMTWNQAKNELNI